MRSWTLPLLSACHAAGRHVDGTVTSAPIVHLRLIPSALFISLVLIVIHSSYTVAGEYINDANNDRGLFPPTFNLASSASITSNATCGENGEETFCKLVEHVREPQCGVCDARSSNASRRHPIVNAIDGTNQWWQSPSLQNGRQFEWVTITLDLQQVYQVAYVIVKAANSPRPGNWILERSLDGVTYLPWQYYAINEAECIEMYSIHPTVGIPRYRSDDEVICTAYFSRLEPLENGEIHTSLVKGRPGVNGPSYKLQEFTAARFVRLRLQKLRSLHADLMTVTTRDWEKVHKTVTRRLFYSIKDISIGGQCMCFGHAPDCRSEQQTGRLRCHCVHNTCGDSCEKCCPLYNQKPWRLGTSTDAGLCEKCQCFGHADECRYDKEVATRRDSLNLEGHYEGGGVCIGCRDFTMGINCEKCLDGYYRPDGVQPDALQPCVKCDCSGLGTSGHCIKDNSLISEGKKAGDCICREGFAGSTCSRCDVGYRNYPVCDLCPCNFAGTANTECEGDCICKQNVDGVRCDRCKPGHFNLDVANPKGCLKCFCSGATGRCVSADLGIQVITSRDGWQVSDVLGQKIIRPTAEHSSWTVASDDMTGHEAYFWLAPEEFTGNRLNVYGGEVRYNLSWVKARGDSAGWLTSGPAIVLDGGGMMIAYWGSGDVAHRTADVVVGVTLSEGGWTHFSPDQVVHPKKIKRKDLRPVNRKNFMEVLSMLDRFLIQARYHTDQIVGKLNSVSIEMGSEDVVTVRRLKNVERCQCPIGYAGLSCESCEVGYRRVNSTAYGGKCEKCNCNGHVNSCDPYTGACHECLHHTIGDNCERCQVGFYGLATTGTPNDCRKCACPLEDPKNQWSDTCTTAVVNVTIVDYTCDACAVGHAGAKCERCDDGYFGHPLVPGNFCQSCHCYGHINGSIHCDHLSGRCVDCLGNREGWHCESCKDGYWGDPLSAPCQACKCDPFGSEDPTKCDKTTGECRCHPLYIGMRCDRCIDNYGNVEAGCHTCQCNTVGSESPTCDPVSGQCQCKVGVFGTKCDTCLDGYYGFGDTGCKWCSCSVNGSLSTTCHPESGQCSCVTHVRGQLCDECEEGYWNLVSERGCQRCQCNPVGSDGSTCHRDTGQCLCKQGIGGTDCSRCLPGFYGFSNNGCQKCAECDAAGHLCDPWTGECVCPPLTTGPSCEACKKNSWGFDPLLGCQLCNCSADGSSLSQCDLKTGQCSCLEGYEGQHCNRCRFGYFDFLKCKRCKCHLDGTDPTKCRLDGHCECSEDGQCPCKINVEGKKCRRCRPGTFGRTPIQVEGCTQCFCFGKSSRCRQADFAWTRLAHLDSRKVAPDDHSQSVYIVHGLRVIPGATGDVEVSSPAHINAPLYWKLPDTLQGDLVASYNGRMVFRVGSEGGQPFPPTVLETYPLVLLQGNYRLVLEYYPQMTSSDGWYDVHLHESRWRFKNNPDIPVDRPTMMVALQRVQHILIRATDRTDFTSAWLTNVSVDVLTTPPKPFGPVVAIGIEICQCPPQYNGTSCQDPANGYYRFRKNDSLDSKDILDLVGVSLPCPCNGRSRECDKETGICKNCQLNTSGNQCERCADGFYGDPSLGPCRPCPCPSVENSFSDRCVLIGSTLTCTNCREGHYGNQCERCMHGYYGDPLAPGGKCWPCDCDVRGSMGNVCNQETGQCLCLEGLTGRDCSVCPRRHVLTEFGCHSCHDECTGLLLDDLDELSMALMDSNLTGINPAPWGRLQAIENRLTPLKRQVDIYKQSLIDGRELAHDFDTVFNLGERADKMLLKIMELQRNSSATCADAAASRWNSQDFLKQSFTIQQLIAETVKRLKDYAAGVAKVSVHLTDAVKEAESKLQQILKVNFGPQDEDANKEYRKAISLLDQVRKLIFDPLRTNDLEKRLKMLSERLTDAQNLIPKNINVIRMQLEDNHLRFNRSKEMFLRANELTNESMAILDMSWDLIRQAKIFIMQIKNNTEMFKEVLMDLEEKTMGLEKHVGLLALKLPKSKEMVKMAEEHAEMLARMAHRLARLFNSTRNESFMAIKAVNAYGDVAKLLQSALDIAIMANDTAMDLLTEVKPVGLPSTKQKADKALQISQDLKMQAMNLGINQLQDLQSQLMRLESNVRATNATNRDNKMQYMDIEMEMNRLNLIPGDFEENVMDINDQSNRAKRLTDQVNKQLKPIVDTLDDRIELANKLAGASNETIWNLTNEVNKTMADIFRLSGITDSDWWKGLDASKNVLKDKLNFIKKDIATIRQGSASWFLGLGGDGKCKRELQHEMTKTSSFSNSLSFDYAISTNHSNSLILYLGDSNMKEYLAMEMVNRTMRFIWDAGGGPTMVQYTRLKLSTDDPNNARHAWYQIEANRTGNRGFIRMRNLKSDTWLETNSSEVTNDYNVITFGPQTRLLIGQIPSGVKDSPLVSRRFHGCLSNVKLNQQSIGLWNFISSSDCLGCKTEIESKMLGFQGNGHLVFNVRGPRGRAKEFFVILFFRTFNENALLFFASDAKEDGFLAVYMSGGQVFLKFRLSNATEILQINTNELHNNNLMTTVQAFQVGIRGALSVAGGQFFTQGDESGKKNLTLVSPFYVGGVPRSFNYTKWKNTGVNFTPFYGCMKYDFQFSDKVLERKFHGISYGCPPMLVNRMIVGEDGYLEMIGHPLKVDSSIGFSIKLAENMSPDEKIDAVLLLSTFINDNSSGSPTKDDFYSLALQKGAFVFNFKGRISKSNAIARMKFNESRHVFIRRTKSSMELRVDDELVETVPLKGSKAIESGRLFFGGVEMSIRDAAVRLGQLPVSKSFRGTFHDVTFDYEPVHLSEYVNRSNVTQGFKASQESPPPVKTTKKQVKRCAAKAQIGTESRALKFGDSNNSYAFLDIRKNKISQRYNMSFDFRTHYPDGLLLVLIGEKRKGRSRGNTAPLYLTIYLDKGSVKIDDTITMSPISIRGTFHDGQWHRVRLKQNKRKVRVEVDIKSGALKSDFSKPSSVGFGISHYKDSLNRRWNIPTFKGCIRNFQINDVAHDLSGTQNSNVGTCFSNVEAGSWFSGDAYAVYDEKFTIGLSVEMGLQFRTTETSGVLISVSDSNGSTGLQLGLTNGNVTLRVILGHGEELDHTVGFGDLKYYVCDDRWHNVTATYSNSYVSLRVDDEYEKVENVQNIRGHLGSGPLYIGGLPDSFSHHSFSQTGLKFIRDNFKGCIRNVVIQGLIKDWIDMYKHNVLLNSCYLQQNSTP